MDQGTAGLLAAGVSAVVAALIFGLGELFRWRREARSLRGAAVARVLNALERVPWAETRPRLLRRFALPDVEVSSAVLRLIEVVPRRDRIVVYWLAGEAERMTRSGRDERVVIAAGMTVRIMAWGRYPRVTREWCAARVSFTPDGLPVTEP